jgi:hypothetical protein
VLEGFLGELAAVLERRILLVQPLDSFGVVRGVDEDQDRGEVLGGGAQDRGSADIDVLERVFERDVRFGGCLAKWVEVYSNDVDSGQPSPLQFLHVLGLVAPGEEAGVDGGMEGLDAAIEYLREGGEFGNGAGGHADLGEVLEGAARGDDFEAEADETTRQVSGAGLIVRGDERDHHE